MKQLRVNSRKPLLPEVHTILSNVITKVPEECSIVVDIQKVLVVLTEVHSILSNVVTKVPEEYAIIVDLCHLNDVNC